MLLVLAEGGVGILLVYAAIKNKNPAQIVGDWLKGKKGQPTAKKPSHHPNPRGN